MESYISHIDAQEQPLLVDDLITESEQNQSKVTDNSENQIIFMASNSQKETASPEPIEGEPTPISLVYNNISETANTHREMKRYGKMWTSKWEKSNSQSNWKRNWYEASSSWLFRICPRVVVGWSNRSWTSCKLRKSLRVAVNFMNPTGNKLGWSTPSIQDEVWWPLLTKSERKTRFLRPQGPQFILHLAWFSFCRLFRNPSCPLVDHYTNFQATNGGCQGCIYAIRPDSKGSTCSPPKQINARQLTAWKLLRLSYGIVEAVLQWLWKIEDWPRRVYGAGRTVGVAQLF